MAIDSRENYVRSMETHIEKYSVKVKKTTKI